jgi:hypothetical protein
VLSEVAKRKAIREEEEQEFLFFTPQNIKTNQHPGHLSLWFADLLFPGSLLVYGESVFVQFCDLLFSS